MYQRTIIIGHLGRDPEMRYTPSGVPVTSFSVATNRSWTNQQGEQQEKTTWFRVTAWNRLAETCGQYLSKGRLVLVEGEIDSSAWLGSDGQPRSSLELRASAVKFLGGRGDQGPAFGPPKEQEEPFSDGPSDESEIPF